ncbi:RING-H2 finger protein ATL46-like [Cynara cardunculus var. scolymus]|uniref:RING-H2 finger protein ATL46-like n=1 Tax=Cynara cardunculus var. scolymus TaxID=59895 RepID=UPI000D629B80|nr:RING-H2 finger protein ATL46-like [Cynara cardunculus var. scolymus]
MGANPELESLFPEKKRSRNPFVPIGALITAGVLTAGLISFKKGNSELGQKLMRARVVAQGGTVALMVGTAAYYGEKFFSLQKDLVLMMGFLEERLLSEHSNIKISWMKSQIYKKDGVLGFQQPISSSLPSSSSSSSSLPSSSYSSFSPPFGVGFHKTSTPSSSSSGTKISPAVLFIIVILAVLFFISGLLHLLVRFLTKHHSSSNSSQSNRYPDGSTSDTLQRQLQQLFHLHDSGLDQTFIDALPVFMYKEVVGANEPFDCAVCLCEFTENDKLRLLPTCSHAFHINCIDTWLLSNSTCPLCRNTLFDPGFSMDNPIFDFDDPREPDENGLSGPKTIEPEKTPIGNGVFSVRLGKFRKLTESEGETGGETSSSNLDARRCYSMGSYEYVVGDANLRVPLSDLRDGQDAKFVNGIEDNNLDEDTEGKKIDISAKTDSYSVSKIWLWSKKRKYASSSENQMHNPSSVDMELPRFGRMQGT